MLLVIAGAIVPSVPGWLAGVCAWGACILLASRLARSQVPIVVALVVLGAAGIAWGMLHGKSGLIERALAQNTPLIAMLIGVSFLQLITTARGDEQQSLETGRFALLRTLLGVHLFGAVINFSAIAIFADRMAGRAKLTLEQAMGLSQAFIVGALWSPFYGAMAVALTAEPAARLPVLMGVGIPVAVCALALSWVTLSSRRYNQARDFAGYPVNFEALWVPAVLALSVIFVRDAKPAWSVMAIIALLAPVVTAVTLLFREGNLAAASMVRLIRIRLPEMGSEMTLFLAAGVLSAGMAGVIAALDLSVPFASFGGFEASILLIAIILFAWLGFHPIIVVSVVGPWLAPLDPDPNLVAMTFLMTWGIGLTACPMAATMLAMRGRYEVPFRELLRRNRGFSFKMTLVCIVVLNVYARLTA